MTIKYCLVLKNNNNNINCTYIAHFIHKMQIEMFHKIKNKEEQSKDNQQFKAVY